MPVQTQLQQRRGTAASWTSTNPTLAAGEIGFESDTGKIKIGTGSTAWNALAYTASSTAVTYLYNATAAQTTFSGADANGLTLAYTVGSEQVYLNGALQVRGSDYTATNGTSIVLTSGALVNDVLNVIAFSALALSDTYTQAQADAKFFQTANAFVAGKNKIINGDFSVNQRNFVSETATQYCFDRWSFAQAGATLTCSAQTFTLGTAPVAGYEGKNFVRLAVTTGSDFARMSQLIESVRTFANQTITISFYAKGTNPTTDGNLKVYLQQNFGTGGSPSATVTVTEQTFVLTANWVRYSFQFAVPSIAGKTLGTANNDYLAVIIGQGSSVSADAWTLDLWGVQAEAGSIATPFQTATGTIQGELAACQRYYFRNNVLSSLGTLAGSGVTTGTTNCFATLQFPVQMRSAVTVLDFANLQVIDSALSTFSVSAATLATSTQQNTGIDFTISGATANRFAFVRGTGTNAYIGVGAEL